MALAIFTVMLTSCSKEESILPAQAKDNVQTQSPNSTNKKFIFWGFTLHIEFGHRKTVMIDGAWVTSPCVEDGICTFDISFLAPGGATGQLGLLDGDLIFELDKSGLDSEIIDGQLSGGTINLAEDLVLQEEVCSALGLEDDYTITAGDYVVVDDGEHIRILL